jgi:hypothetical protein
MLVRDVPDDYILVSDSQDITATLESIGYDGDPSDYGCLFVLVGDGDYVHVYGCESNVPYLSYSLDHLYGELSYAEQKIAQYGSWSLFSDLTRLEMEYSRQFWALADSYIDGEIRRGWNWESIYESAYADGGSLWLGTYSAVIESEAEFCDHDSDPELYGYICDAIEESINNIAESYGGTVDFESGEVYFYTEVDIP